MTSSVLGGMHVTMPRTARIDTPGLLHHIMIRNGEAYGTLLTMLNNSIVVADRMEPTIQESKGKISQHSQQRPCLRGVRLVKEINSKNVRFK